MQYYSTRSNSNPLPGHQAVIRGLSPDGGLYVPEDISLSISWESLRGKSYAQIAEAVLNAFFPDYGAGTVRECVSAAYSNSFDDDAIVPLKAFRDGDGRSYTDYLDLDSAVSFWWVQEFSQNQDAAVAVMEEMIDLFEVPEEETADEATEAAQ